MARFAARRLAGMALVLFVVSLVVFAIFNLIPNSDPAQRLAGKNGGEPILVRNIEKEWGFDEPLPVQYGTMMKKILSGDLISYSERLNVDDRIVEGIPATFSLCIGAAVIWMFFGVLFGYLSAVKAGGWLDRVLTVGSVAGISIPVFLIAAVFLYLFTFKLELFPSSGYVPLLEDPIQWAYHLILPWFTLAILNIGFYSRVLRSNMLDAMREDYVRTARAKGLSERRVLIRHVLRNSLIPIVTLFGLDFGGTIGGGAIITEVIFGLNGVGQYAADSITNLDLPPLMAITLFGAFFVVLFNALTDVVYAYLDPRIRLGTSAR
ncbi:MAG: binding-protein-dependent transport system inner rane component [Solirubrobacterales bacterium]|nr:binding-protein-dependent transport system inner rane component [Solirubrobacterales bacterium]